MDTHTPDGLQNSFEQNLIDSNEIDVLVSNYFLAGSALFTPNHHGRTFTIMRHPIDLAQSLFHYRQTASWERSYRQKWSTWNFEGYVKSEYYMSNWMVRQLTGTMPNEILNETHLERAKEVVRTKIFVGISTQLEETIRQLQLYYGWEEQKPFCAFNFINAPTNANHHPKLERGGEVWSAVAEIEKWDLALYYYSLELFSGQRERFPPPTSVEESVIGVAPVVGEPKNGQNSRNMLHVISK